jgi:uncharacterized FAD-dependent dehydrogenase
VGRLERLLQQKRQQLNRKPCREYSRRRVSITTSRETFRTTFSRLAALALSRETTIVHSSLELVLDLDHAYDIAAQRSEAAKILGCDPARVHEVRVRKRSLDARGQIRVRLVCDVWLDEDAPEEVPPRREYSRVAENAKRVVIIGCGPAGMFAALRLLQLGLKPIILERGKDVQARRRDLARINREGIVNADSNYCFGEGGAGTYSDGKLYTRVKDKNAIGRILRALVAHGAQPDILVDAHPHIGSNRLPKIVAALRESIRAAGGEVHFNARVEDFLIEENRLRAVTTSDNREFSGDAFVLAAGHSGREIFGVLAQRGVQIEAKPFAMGVRIEHPQPLIDKIQYRNAPPVAASTRDNAHEWRHPNLPAASYRLAHTVNGRGVFSFCMCPGGWIVPSATHAGEVVINGMSLSRRDSPFANSGLVVSVEVEDYAHLLAEHGALAGLVFQRELEKAAFTAGGNEGESGQKAPAQRVTDFLKNRVSQTLPKTSYQPGIRSAPLHEALPPHFARRLHDGLTQFDKSMRGYITEEAILVGVESRTSSPVRVPRDASTREHPQIRGLFPCGEGAGYAGGIVSAAIDGERTAEACAAVLK